MERVCGIGAGAGALLAGVLGLLISLSAIQETVEDRASLGLEDYLILLGMLVLGVLLGATLGALLGALTHRVWSLLRRLL